MKTGGQDPEKIQGLILRIQRMSTEDGPGIRSTVFFKGCPLNCVWCHNPESIPGRPQVHWVNARCIGCLSCIGACPEQALKATSSGIEIDRRACTDCLCCAEACPSTAMEVYGRYFSPEELVDELVKDCAYFEQSGGGVTLSGGEPTRQPDFAREVLRSLKEKDIHTALDTCGQCAWERLEMLLPSTDLLLYDLKLMDEELHRDCTGLCGGQIQQNLTRVRDYRREHGSLLKIWVRTPIIPGHTDSEENIRAIGAFIRDTMDGAVSRWELCAFNNLCTHKYDGLGIDWKCRDYGLVADSDMKRLVRVAARSVGRSGIVHASGTTAMKESHGHSMSSEGACGPGGRETPLSPDGPAGDCPLGQGGSRGGTRNTASRRIRPAKGRSRP